MEVGLNAVVVGAALPLDPDRLDAVGVRRRFRDDRDCGHDVARRDRVIPVLR